MWVVVRDTERPHDPEVTVGRRLLTDSRLDRAVIGTRPPECAEDAGFKLLEIIVVLVCLGLLMAALLVQIRG